ncbi:CB1 cannabinoid receptor-interacting protein 1 [Dirofilaria immitis]|nr:CB1 cannabinoid receptor-interacting protein 1 [Dirofilaria immitis]
MPEDIDAKISRIANSPSSSTAGFELQFNIRKYDTGEPITFKVDGGRFGKTQEQDVKSDVLLRTYKFRSEVIYKITLTTKPATDVLHISGSDLELRPESIGGGVYSTEWNTTGSDVTLNRKREYITICLQGPGRILQRKLQAKFYRNDNNHADYGDKLEALIWKCAVDNAGNIAVVDETVK